MKKYFFCEGNQKNPNICINMKLYAETKFFIRISFRAIEYDRNLIGFITYNIYI